MTKPSQLTKLKTTRTTSKEDTAPIDDNMDNDERVEEMISLVLEAARLFSGDGGGHDHAILYEPKEKKIKTSAKNGNSKKKRNARQISNEMSTDALSEGGSGVMTRSMRNKKALLI
jgi:hypothetical protein